MNDARHDSDWEGLPATLQTAVGSVVAEPVPEDAVRRVAARARELAGTVPAAAPRTAPIRRWPRAAWMIGAGLAASVLLAAGVLLLDRSARPAFAEVLANVRAARSVRFATTTQLGGGREIHGHMQLEGDRLRLEQFDGKLVQVADLAARRALVLDIPGKRAQHLAIDAQVARAFDNPVEQLRQVTAGDAERIGQEILRGRRTDVYRIRHGELLGIRGAEMLVWVDVESALPARIVIRNPDPRAESRFDFDQFAWNEPLPAELFSLEVPKGFKLGEVALSPPQAPRPAGPQAAPALVGGVLRDRVPATILWNGAGTAITALMRDPESTPPLERRSVTLRQWDIHSGKLLWSQDVAGAASVAQTTDGTVLATVVGRQVQLRDAADGRVTRTWTTADPLSPLAFSPDGKTLAAGITEWGRFGGDGGEPSGGVQLWDVERGELLRTIEDDKPTTAVAYSVDGRRVAASSGDGPVRLFDTHNGELARVFPGRRATFSADGQMLACFALGSPADKTVGQVDLFDLEDASLVKSLTSQPGSGPSWMLGLTFSPDGTRLAATDWNGTVTIWDVASGERQRTIDEHEGGVVSAAFSPDGKTLATGGEDRTLRLWRLAD